MSLEPLVLGSRFDVKLELPRGSAARAALAKKRVLSEPYDRERLLRDMVVGRLTVLDDFPTGLRGAPQLEEVTRLLTNCLKPSTPARVQMGPGRLRRWAEFSHLLRRWRENRFLTSTTDLHFRGTALTHRLRTNAISDFNLLAPPRHSPMEMMTLVLSTTGNVTESHSDDCDGTNHCLLGSKLWLVWDRAEGAAVGLQDATYDRVYEPASFDLSRFLRLRSSRWFIVTPGKTLFLPGNLTHRVITLERYFGFGSFYISLANWPRTFARWLTTGARYMGPSFLAPVTQRVYRKARAIADQPALHHRFGWDATHSALTRGARRFSTSVRHNPAYRAFEALVRDQRV